MLPSKEMSIGDWIHTPSGSGDISELYLSKDSIHPADFVITINLDPADAGKTIIHSIHSRNKKYFANYHPSTIR